MMNYKDIYTSNIEFSDCRKIIVLADKRHPKIKFIANNPNGRFVCVFYVDGGLIADNDAKCDKLLVAENKDVKHHPDFYFVELKGADFQTAIRQLNRSIDILMCQIDYRSVNCRLVMSRCPDIKSTDEIRLERKLKNMNGNFRRQSRQLEETI